ETVDAYALTLSEDEPQPRDDHHSSPREPKNRQYPRRHQRPPYRKRSIPECFVLPFGLGPARRPIARKGSLGKATAGGAITGSRRTAGFPRCDRTSRSPLATRRKTRSAFFLNSSMVTVFIEMEMKLKFKLNMRNRQEPFPPVGAVTLSLLADNRADYGPAPRS